MMSPIYLCYNHCVLEPYDINDVEILSQMHKNITSIYSSFLPFVTSFSLIKSPKYTHK
jgi:hypothetical protein